VINVEFTTTTFVAGVPPTSTAEPAANPYPKIRIAAPPATSPPSGVTPVTSRPPPAYVNAFGRDAVAPSPLRTTTVTAPATPGGVRNEIDDGPSTWTPVAGAPPNVTTVPENPVPVIVSGVPPRIGPLATLSPLIERALEASV